MKTIIILLASLLLLASCGMTNQEIVDAVKLCNDAGLGTFRTLTGDVECSIYKNKPEDKVLDCIREYTEGIDQKYNNPDTVTNLREDNYSNVVKTCNEIFGSK